MFLLLLLTFNTGVLTTEVVGSYSKMDDCFTHREILVENIGRPIINYQSICLNISGDHTPEV